MATKYFNAMLEGQGQYLREHMIDGTEINSQWLILNLNSDNRSMWGLDANNWIQYRSAFMTYAGRYSEDDLSLGDTYFDVELQPAGSGNFEVGFFFRFIDKFSFYYLTFNGGYQDWGSANIRLMKVVGGTHYKISEYTHPIFNTATTYKFRVELVGTSIKIYLTDFTTPIINTTDPNGYLRGAFGPFVKGQEWAKWKGFNAKNVKKFLVTNELTNVNVTIDQYDTTTAKLLHADSISTLLQPKVDEVILLEGDTPINQTWDQFKVSSSDPSVHVILDRTLNNIGTDPNALIYAYQELPKVVPVQPINPQLIAVDANTIKLTWEHVDETEEGFNILDENDNIVASVGVNTFQIIETNLSENTTYYRKIVSFNIAGDSIASDTVSVTTPQTIPMAPSNFKGIPMSTTEIEWSWINQAFNAEAIELITWDELGNVVVIATLTPDTMSYSESGLSESTTYTRAVRAKNGAGYSPDSNVYSISTKDPAPTPPQNAPQNAYGVGVSDGIILWYWEDMSNTEDGFEILDKDNNVLYTIDANKQQFMEGGLYPSWFYHRKIRAFNAYGKGPSTPLISAKTLSEGSDYADKPLAPINLRAEVLSTTEAIITWDYTDNPDLPAAGFKVYTSDGYLVIALQPEVREYRFINLQPNTTYPLFIVAFNENGNSEKSNVITFITPHIIQEPEKPVTLDELEDPFYGVEYDKETEDTGKILAFQSGIGDNLDLKISNLYPIFPNLEQFSYEMYIKGTYDIVNYHYPRIDFKFRIITTGLLVTTVEVAPDEYKTIIRYYYQPTEWFDAYVNGLDINEGKKSLTVPVSTDIPYGLQNVEYRVEVKDESGHINWFLNNSGTDATTDPSDFIIFESNFYEEIITQGEWRGAKFGGTHLEIEGKKEITFTDKIQSPKVEIPWQQLSQEYTIENYQIVVTSTNPNVQIILEKEISNFIPQDSQFIEVHMRAKIINQTQTAWYPSVHNGYYYLNQQEHYLFINDKVRPKDGDIDETYVLNFPYVIKAYAIRHYDAQHMSFTHTDKVDFLQGSFNEDISVDKIGGSVTLSDFATTGIYTSPIIDFKNSVESWDPIIWHQNENVISNGAKLVVEVGKSDEMGVVTQWVEQINQAPLQLPEVANKIRYRLKLTSAQKKNDITPDFYQDNETLKMGYADKVLIENDKVSILNPKTNQEALFITKPIDLGTLINDLGTVDLTINKPANTKLEIYSVTSDSSTHTWTTPTTDSPWVPVELISSLDNNYTYRIKSSGKRWMVLVFKFFRGYEDAIYEALFNTTTFDASLATNLEALDGTIKLVDPSQEGFYQSKAIFIGNALSFNTIATTLAETYQDSEIVVSTVTANSESELQNLSLVESEWKIATGGIIQSTPKQWLMYRVRIAPGKTNITTYKYKDDTQIEWASHQQRTNMTITSDGSITPTDKAIASEYVSELFQMDRTKSIGTITIKYKGTPSHPDGIYPFVFKLVRAKDGIETVSSILISGVPTTDPTDPTISIIQIDTFKDEYPEDELYYTFKNTPELDDYEILSVEFGDVAFDFISPVINQITIPANVRNYLSASASDIHIKPNLYNYSKVSPIIQDITIGGNIPSGNALESYLIPMAGSIIADAKVHDITKQTVEEIVYGYLAEQGIENDESINFTDYILEVDPSYPVQLSPITTGKEFVKATAQANVGDVLYKDIKIYFDMYNRGAVLKPIPQMGSPIVVKNTSGKLLQQVHFRDSLGDPTLTNLEYTEVSHERYLFTSYKGIDPWSLEVYIDINNRGEWEQIFNVELQDNRIVLPNYFVSGTKAKILYKIKDSFFIDYNYSPEEDFALIRVHTGFNPDIPDTRQLTIKYEVDKNTPYRLIKELNLNPLRNNINSGFIYLTDKIYPPFKIEVNANPNMIYKNREDRLTINAKILDEFGNPVVGAKVNFNITKGSIQIINHTSDNNGLVTAIYTPPKDSEDTIATITITEVTKQISKELTVYLIEEKFPNKITIIPEKNAVKVGDIVKLKVIVSLPNNERIPNETVQIYADHGSISPQTATTDAYGEITAYYIHEDMHEPYALIEAESSGSKEQILLGISEV